MMVFDSIMNVTLYQIKTKKRSLIISASVEILNDEYSLSART
jgi:hypothetical protein